MEKKHECCTPKGQVPRYVDCKGCDKKPIEKMSKQTAVELLEQQLKERYSLMNSEPLFEQAKQMEKEQIKNNYLKGCAKVFDIICDSRNGKPIEFIDADKYYNETYQTQITK